VAPPYVEPKDVLSGAAFEPQSASGLPRTRSTSGSNYTGHPALSVPCGRSGALPIGMQLVGRYYDEAVLLRAAYAFQHAVDWDAMTGLPAGTTPASR
jgi:amidase